MFNNFNIKIPPGQKVGIVGFSGAGKSTFANLIMGFYQPDSGEILINDKPLTSFSLETLHSNIAMIPQEPILFNRTIKENISYGRPTASDDEIVKASKLAHCHEFITVLKDGYNAFVGERGVKLSGGQRQRIAIARAMLINTPIMILDEATSSLDSVTEKLIQDGLKKLMGRKTVIIIAHRLSTLVDMDRILVFNDGEIVEDGNLQALISQNGCFKKLWNLQADGLLPATKNGSSEIEWKANLLLANPV